MALLPSLIGLCLVHLASGGYGHRGETLHKHTSNVVVVVVVVVVYIF